MKFYLRILLILLFNIFISSCYAAKVKALFLGNSYTSVHNLPQLVANIAQSCGDTLIFSSNTPGGYTFQQHSTNTQSLNFIQQGNWDYLILQEQSQLPSFPIQQVQTQCYPYARILDSIFNASNPCGETVFYRTWGRKNGDSQNCPSWPPVCTYEGMDSLLNLRYRIMADSFNAVLSPAGQVWKYIRQNNPSVELYDSDGSHPSATGAMATALTFYTVLFRKDPSPNTYYYTISSSDYTACLNAVNVIARDSLYTWNIGKYDPQASFAWSQSPPLTVSFNNTSVYSSAFSWDFGDGSFSSSQNPVHSYLTAGTYQVSLTAVHCNYSDTTTQTITVAPAGIEGPENTSLVISPNPANNKLIIKNISQTERNFPAKIYDLHGRKLMESGISGGTTTEINIECLKPGCYILELLNKRFHFIKQ